MEQDSTTTTDSDSTALFAGDAWFDPIEAGIRERIRGFIERVAGSGDDGGAGACTGTNGRAGDAEGLPTRNAANGSSPAVLSGPIQLSVPRARHGGWRTAARKEWRSAGAAPLCPDDAPESRR